MLLSHSGEYTCECKESTFAANSPEMIRLPRRITEKVRRYKWLRMLANFLRIPANFLRSLRLLNNQFAEFLVNPFRMLRILTNALANVANACEYLTNETTTQSMRGEPSCQCFAVSLSFAS